MRVFKRTPRGESSGDNKGYICDTCLKEIKGGAIIVYFPESHPLATDPSFHFCSDPCVLGFIEKSVKDSGAYKAKVVKVIKPSKEATEPVTPATSEPYQM